MIGPLVPSNFDYAAQLLALKELVKIAPLSSKAVKQQSQVVQSVVDLAALRTKMVDYLAQQLDTTQNVMIIADTLNAAFVEAIGGEVSFAHRVRQRRVFCNARFDRLALDRFPAE